MVKTLKVADIHITPFLQTRSSGVVPDVVRDYAELLKAGVEFPPVVVYELSDRFKGQRTLAVGFHRVEAHKLAGVESIKAEVRKGKWSDAWLASWASNLTHGVRYNNNDKREAVKTALKLFPKDSPAVIAEKLGVSDDLVRKIRKTLIATKQIEDNEKVVGRDGAERPTKRNEAKASDLPLNGSCQEPTSECQPEPGASEPESTAPDPEPQAEPVEVSPEEPESDSAPAIHLHDHMLAALHRAMNEISGYRPYKQFAGVFRELDALRAELERKAA